MSRREKGEIYYAEEMRLEMNNHKTDNRRRWLSVIACIPLLVAGCIVPQILRYHRGDSNATMQHHADLAFGTMVAAFLVTLLLALSFIRRFYPKSSE